MNKIQDILLSLGQSGCLLLDYAELAGIPVIDVINNFDKLILEGIIRQDCYVLNADKLMTFFDKSFRVAKISIEEVKKGERYIASFERNGYNHFVICEGDKVVYNTLINSKCVKYGTMNNTVRVLR